MRWVVSLPLALAAVALLLTTSCADGDDQVQTVAPHAVGSVGDTPEDAAAAALGQVPAADATASDADDAGRSAAPTPAELTSVLRFCDEPATFDAIADEFSREPDQICVAVGRDNVSIYLGVDAGADGWTVVEVIR